MLQDRQAMSKNAETNKIEFISSISQVLHELLAPEQISNSIKECHFSVDCLLASGFLCWLERLITSIPFGITNKAGYDRRTKFWTWVVRKLITKKL
jgi:predicted membrane-bound dolichyl-phosphate-mannose-protein mannosyltransferase